VFLEEDGGWLVFEN